MLRKLFLWACVFLFTSGFEILNAQFQFNYTGPDTLYLNNNCSVQLNWGSPATPTVTSTIGATITSFELFSISGGYQTGSLIDHETNVEITYKAIDNQLNSAFFTFNIAIEDTLRPNIITLPIDKSFTCETPESTIIAQLYLWYNNHAGMVASDNCGSIQYLANKTLQEVETAFNQSINDNCGSTRSVTVIFSAIDQYENTSANSYAATFLLLTIRIQFQLQIQNLSGLNAMNKMLQNSKPGLTIKVVPKFLIIAPILAILSGIYHGLYTEARDLQ